MTWYQPNLPASPTALQTAASTEFACDMQAKIAAIAGNGVISGCGLSESGTPDMNVVVAAGIVRINGANYAVTGGNAAVGSNASGNPRIDVISVDDSDTITVTAGTAAATPDAPEIPAGNIYLGLVYVANGETALEDAEIFNRQVVIDDGYYADPTLQTWTALNQGIGTWTEDATNKILKVEFNGNGALNLRGWTTPRPSDPTATPYTIDAHFTFNAPYAASVGFVLGWRQSSDGKLVTAFPHFPTSATCFAAVAKWGSTTSFSAHYFTAVQVVGIPYYIRIREDATTRYVYQSTDGKNFSLIHSVGRTDYMTADQIFIGIIHNAAGAWNTIMTVDHFEVS